VHMRSRYAKTDIIINLIRLWLLYVHRETGSIIRMYLMNIDFSNFSTRMRNLFCGNRLNYKLYITVEGSHEMVS